MSESRQDKRKYEPVMVEYNHHDSATVEKFGIYGPQAKFLYSFALSSMKVSPLGAFIMITGALVSEVIKWGIRDLCLALNGRRERQDKDAKGATNPADLLPDAPISDEQTIADDAASVAA